MHDTHDFSGTDAFPVSTAEVLREAKTLIMRDGWIQGRMYDAMHGHCMHGALTRACEAIRSTRNIRPGAPLPSIDAVFALQEAILEPVAAWNDRPGRTVREVLDAFDRAIALLEGAGVHRGE